MRLLLYPLFGAAILANAPAQFSFTDRTELLSAAGLGSRESSGVAIGVADMNGDGRDDIVRFDNTEALSVEYQTTPEAVFVQHVDGNVLPSKVWATVIADEP